MLEICNFKSLKSLRIEKTIMDCSSMTSTVQQLSTLTALTHLKVVNVSVDSQVLCSILKRLRYLKSLKVAHTSAPPREVPGMLDCLTELKSLEEVDLEGIKVPWQVIDMLPSSKRIIMPCPAADSPQAERAELAQVRTPPATAQYQITTWGRWMCGGMKQCWIMCRFTPSFCATRNLTSFCQQL